MMEIDLANSNAASTVCTVLGAGSAKERDEHPVGTDEHAPAA